MSALKELSPGEVCWQVWACQCTSVHMRRLDNKSFTRRHSFSYASTSQPRLDLLQQYPFHQIHISNAQILGIFSPPCALLPFALSEWLRRSRSCDLWTSAERCAGTLWLRDPAIAQRVKMLWRTPPLRPEPRSGISPLPEPPATPMPTLDQRARQNRSLVD